jgi:MOSC domain-containing protein YiiM
MIKKFLASRRTGFYFAVVQEGEVGRGDVIQRISQDPHGVTVVDITDLYANKRTDPGLVRRAIHVEALPESWRTYFQARLRKSHGAPKR